MLYFVFSFLLTCCASSLSVSWIIQSTGVEESFNVNNKKEFRKGIKFLKMTRGLYQEEVFIMSKPDLMKSQSQEASIIIIKNIDYQDLIKPFENILFNKEILEYEIVRITLRKSLDFVRITCWTLQWDRASRPVFERRFKSYFPDSKGKFLHLPLDYNIELSFFDQKENLKFDTIDLKSFISLEKDNIIRIYSRKNANFTDKIILMYSLNKSIEDKLINDEIKFKYFLRDGRYSRVGVYKSNIPLIKSFVFFQQKANSEDEMSKNQERSIEYKEIRDIRVIYVTPQKGITTIKKLLECIIGYMITYAH